MPDKAQPGRTICSRFGSIVFREHSADDVFVDIDAKGTRYLLRDAGTANTGIAALERDDRVDEFFRWPFWSGAPMNSRREKPPVFAFLERLVGGGVWSLDHLRAGNKASQAAWRTSGR